MADENTIIAGFVASIEAADIAGMQTVEAFAGDIEDVFEQLRRLPAVLVFLEDTTFEAADSPGDLLEGDPVVTLLVADKSLLSRKQGQAGIYDILKACREALHNTDAGVSGAIWYVRDQRFIDARRGLALYRQRYRGENVFF